MPLFIRRTVSGRPKLTFFFPDRQIPTVLSYIGGEQYHGSQAKAQLIRNASNTVAYFRDYLGKK